MLMKVVPLNLSLVVNWTLVNFKDTPSGINQNIYLPPMFLLVHQTPLPTTN
jgi:hypothetical protein